MSIGAAVAALNKEIEVLDKKKARLESLRDALAIEGVSSDTATAVSVPAKKGKRGPKPGQANKGKPGPKPGAAKKAATVTTPASVRKLAAPKKRLMSPEAKKKIGDAVKARWAAKAAKQTA